ncbi:U-box domain-containing protein 4 [Vitis vinifera]|uniref:U-box domain-containing protein 4 n=1 Tax=Vitis vinifera TaxID=29760 RepID=A0A438CNZ7_VITVI|nr:U-box domain-containing protein 4 [Vitis vinifera]
MESELHFLTTPSDPDTPRTATTAVNRTLHLLQSDDPDSQIQAAKEIRRLTKTSQKCRRQLSPAVRPLVSMLRLDSLDSNEAALLALLNLAVKDENMAEDHVAVSFSYCIKDQTTCLVLKILNIHPASQKREFSLTLMSFKLTGSFSPFSDMMEIKPLAEIMIEACCSVVQWCMGSCCIHVTPTINKVNIVASGALEPIISFLQSQNSNMQEYATASLLTLSASTINKPTISAAGAIPLLVEILRHGSPQARVDAVLALYNLSTYSDNISIILEAKPIPSIVDLLKTCKKSSKTTEKCSALIESLVAFDEGRTALTSEEGGVLAVVEVLENGSLQSREHAVGALLTMCQSDRCKYREPILREGVIPGLLELTVQGTPKSQSKAQTLLRLLRDSPHPRSELQPDTLENIVCNLISQIDSEDQSRKAKKMLAEMVQVSMEQSLRHLQQRAVVCTPTDLPINNCTSEVSSK